MKRSYYQNNICDFIYENEFKILGELTGNHHFSLDIMQKNAWIEQIDNLKQQLQNLKKGYVFFEFSIPRMGKRVDVLIIVDGVIFVIEYKTGARSYDKHSIDQVMDYALDLKNFHEGSHNKYIVPILISTKAPTKGNVFDLFKDNISSPLTSNGTDLEAVIKFSLKHLPKQKTLDGDSWANTSYKPTPTIVEAAQALYQGHSVEEISRSDAGAKNLTHTANCLSKIIDRSRKNKKKSICFITGVPGAGKTLAGLNISTKELQLSNNELAVFLSGNGPLVDVLREALARDDVARIKRSGGSITKKEARSKVSAFIQNVHHFRDEGIKSTAEPIEHVIIFDEAQRAWNQDTAQKFMETKKGVPNFEMSEPEFLISVMDRKKDWCTIVCLIGGGQEINTGEAGLIEWVKALEKKFNHWDIYYSDKVTHKDYSWNQNLPLKLEALNAEKRSDLHLSTSIRSYRAENLSSFIGYIIDGDINNAQLTYKTIKGNYPIKLTRNIDKARKWLKGKARGTERSGLVASSGGIRLKPEGVHVKNKIDPSIWFLNNKDDVRSSYFLEDVATQFDIQGLELDWVGVCWDADFRRIENKWYLSNFKGTKWQNINDHYRRVYLANAYRVLLTRARQGMVIFIPKGNNEDSTRLPEFYDETFNFLKSCGIEDI